MNDLIHALGIDWFALLAQVVNFGILVFVLTKFVYKPVLNMIDERRRVITESMEKAKEIDQQKELVDKQRTEILKKADKEAGALLERAKNEADAIRIEIEKNAKTSAAATIAKGMQQLENERARAMKELQDKLAKTIVKSAETILRREFSEDDQKSFEDELKKNIPAMLS